MEKKESALDPPSTLRGILWRLCVVQRNEPGYCQEVQQAIRQAPGAARIETACLVRFGEFTEATFQRLFAEVAQARGQTFGQVLTRCLPLDPTAAADYLDGVPKTEPAAPEPPASTAAGKGVAPRNEWFLKQYETPGDTFHRPSKVCAKWRALKLSEREAICPDSPGPVLQDAVVTAIKRARQARGDKPAARRKRTTRRA